MFLNFFLSLRGADIIRNFALLCSNLPPKCKAGSSYSIGTLIAMQFFWKFCVCKVNEAANNYFRKNNSSSKQNICAADPLWYYLFWFLKKENIILQMSCHFFDIFVNMFPLALSRGERSIETIALLVQWSMTIENHWNQRLNDPKTIEKPLKAMVWGLKISW